MTFEQFHGKAAIGSSRIRARWLWERWNQAGPDLGTAEQYMIGKDYEAIIFQKVYWPDFAETYEGLKILDVCDADFLHWGCRMIQTINACHGVTTSSLALQQKIAEFTDKPVRYIPDRLALDTLPAPKIHLDEKPTVAWFGYADNFEALDSAIPALMKRKLNLIVISNKTYRPQIFEYLPFITNYPWSEATVDGDLLRADMIINPKISRGRFAYKSDNKSIHAAALGLPTARTDADLDLLMEYNLRKVVAEQGLKAVQKSFDVKQSVAELKDFIVQLQHEA